MIRTYFIILAILSLLSSCGKLEDDILGSEDMAGKVYLLNPYDNLTPQIKAGQNVLLQKATDSLPTSYLFSSKSNDAGEFTFKYLGSGEYKLYSELYSSTRWDSSILYSVSYPTSARENIVLTLQPDTVKQNGLFFLCLDSVMQNPAGVIPYDSIYIYMSGVLAAKDSSAISGQGSSYQLVGNVQGRALKMNLPFDRPLYINSACTYGETRFKSIYSVVQLRSSGIDTVLLRLRN